MADGLIDLDRACAIAARTASMSDAGAACADRLLAAAAPGLGHRRLDPEPAHHLKGCYVSDGVLGQAALVGVGDRLSAVAGADLRQQVVDVALHRGLAHHKPCRDLCRRVLAQQFPDHAAPGSAWHRLQAATGRPVH